MMPPLLLLDLDGTLVDTLGFIIDCFRRAVMPCVRRPPSDEEIIATFGPAEPECIARLLTQFDRESLLLENLQTPQIEGCVTRFLEFYHDGYAAGRVQPFPDIVDIIHEAKASGWLLGIFTGKGKVTTRETLDHLGLVSMFDVIVTSNDVPHPKPAPDGVRLAAWRLATTPSRTIFVGDNPADILAGKKAGATTAAALWGAFDRQKTMAVLPDFAFEHPDELRILLKSKSSWLHASTS